LCVGGRGGGGSPAIEISLGAEFVVFVGLDANTSFVVFTDTFFEVGVSLKGDGRHPRERVEDLIHARLLEGD
jgi:hypothetical protein